MFYGGSNYRVALSSLFSLFLSPLLSLLLSFFLFLSLVVYRSSICVKWTLEIIFIERQHRNENIEDAHKTFLGQLHLLLLLSPMIWLIWWYDYSTQRYLSQRYAQTKYFSYMANTLQNLIIIKYQKYTEKTILLKYLKI